MVLGNSRAIVLIVYSVVMLTRGAIGYSLKESSCMSAATNYNLYYLDEGVTGIIVLLAERRYLTRLFLGLSAAVHGYLVLAQALNLFPIALFASKIGDLIVNTDCCLLLLAYLFFKKGDEYS